MAFRRGKPEWYIVLYRTGIQLYPAVSDGMKLFGVKEAFAAAPATLVGFTDMFIPALLLGCISSVKTKFIVGVLSLVQIIYLTEVGTIIIKSEIPLNLWKLFLIFMERTLIAIPLIVLFANLFL